MKTANSKTAAVSFETIKTLLSCQPETELDAKGYSEKNVIYFISILFIHPAATVPGILRLRKPPRSSSRGSNLKIEFLVSEIFCAGSREKLVFQMQLTPIIRMLIEQWPQNEGSEFIFPFLQLTKEDENLLDQAGCEGEDIYSQVLQRIERKKIRDFHMNVNKYLEKIAARENLDMKITLHAMQETLRHSYNLAPPPSERQYDIMQRMGSLRPDNDGIARLISYAKGSN